MDDNEKSVSKILDAYSSAVLNKDVDAFMKLYSPDVRVFDAWEWSFEGAVAWRQAIEKWLGSLGTERVKVTFDKVVSIGGSELANVSATVTYAAISADGEALHSVQNRLTWALKRSGNALIIIHEHTSLPTKFE
jgi:ketosteroid isomerase-like protein